MRFTSSRWLPIWVAGLLLVAADARAATLTPTTTADQFDPVADGECSLREAVESANLDADFGGCVADGAYGDDVIVLAAATYVLDLGPPEDAFDLDNAVGDLDVVPDAPESLDVVGAGAEVSIVERSDAAADFRVFDTDIPGFLRLVDLTVRNGVDEVGGGIFSFGFSLVLERVVLRDNRASGDEAAGGGIAAITEVVSLTDTSITGNRADGTDDTAVCDPLELFVGGGGVFLIGFPSFPGELEEAGAGRVTAAATIPESSLLSLERTTISDNVTTSASPDCPAVGGGAILIDLAAVLPPELFLSRIVNSTFSGNRADVGGGLVVAEDVFFGGPGPGEAAQLTRRALPTSAARGRPSREQGWRRHRGEALDRPLPAPRPKGVTR